jgi:branched-chain amino acid transport system substrate-binding protein
MLAGAAVGKSGGVQVLPASSCAKVVYGGSGSPDLLIASDLPLQGAGRAQTTSMVKAIELIIQQANYTAGKYKIGYQSCDDATAQAGKWDSAKCTANAQAYANDRSVVGVIGTFNSGCAQLIIPILNRAPNGPLAMVSPANTRIGLTHVAKGLTDPGEPQKYYPTGKRNYARVVASDDYQAPAAAQLAKDLKRRSVYIIHDNEGFGKGVALSMQAAATKLGLRVEGFEAWDGKAASYEALAEKIKQSGAQAVYLGGIVCNNGGKLVKDLRAALGPSVALIAPDGFTPISAVVDGAGTAANGLYVSAAGPPNEALGATGKKFVAALAKVLKRKPDPYPTYAAQAAVVLLSAIARSDGTRASVTKGLFNRAFNDSIMGTFVIDKNGDTSLKGITFFVVKKGEAATYKGFTVPPSLL